MERGGGEGAPKYCPAPPGSDNRPRSLCARVTNETDRSVVLTKSCVVIFRLTFMRLYLDEQKLSTTTAVAH